MGGGVFGKPFTAAKQSAILGFYDQASRSA
jgi:hypothetical protein